jgi:hypothetical protein
MKNYYNYSRYVKDQVQQGLRPKREKERKLFSQIFEFHHIIPKCIGGDDSLNNLIPLTIREHLLAHFLLTKIYPSDSKLAYSYYKMSCYHSSSISSKKAAEIRENYFQKYHGPNFGKKMSEEQKKKISESKKGTPAWNKGLPCTWHTSRSGWIMSEEHKKKISMANSGKPKPAGFSEKSKEMKTRYDPITGQRIRSRNPEKRLITYSEALKKGLITPILKKPYNLQGLHWYTNGKNNCQAQKCPIGWRPGKTHREKA